MKFLTAVFLFLAMAARSWAKPPYQVLGYCYSTQNANNQSINLSTDIPWSDLTQVGDAFAIPNNDGTLNVSGGGAKGASLISAAHSNGVRCFLSIGGGGQGGAFPTISEAANLANFVSNVTNTVSSYGYDGVDIDWEFPDASQETQATNMMQALYTAIKSMSNSSVDNLPRTLSFTISAGSDVCGWNFFTIGAFVDYGIIMGYDYYTDVYNGPLGGEPNGTNCAGNTYEVDLKGDTAQITNGSIGTFPINKLILACPLYVNDYNAGTEIDVLTAIQNGTAGAYQSAQAEQLYTWTDGNQVAVDTSQSYCDKINWALSKGFKGIGMWDIGQALPYTSTYVSSIWNTIGGNATCLTLPSHTFSPSPTAVLASKTASPTASPSLTRTPSPSPSASTTMRPSPSQSPSPTLSVTPSMTLSPSPTASKTLTASPSMSSSPSATETRSATQTLTESPTQTASATRTPSPISSPSMSPSTSPTTTETRSVTQTLTESPTQTASATRTQSPLSSPSMSPSTSSTATETRSSTLTKTVPATQTASPTTTDSPSLSPSLSPSPSSSHTPIETPTVLLSPSSSPSPVISYTLSPSVVASATPSFTVNPSESPTTTLTPSPSTTLSDSPTILSTSTQSPSPTTTISISTTMSSSPSPTLLVTSSASVTLASTSTLAVPSSSDTPTPAPLATATPQSSPKIGSLSVTEGPISGGTTIVISGTGFSSGMTASLGGVAVSVVFLSPTRVEIISPPHREGPVTLVLTNEPSNLSATKVGAFNYLGSSSSLDGPIVIDKALPDLNPSPHGPSSFKILFEGAVDSLTLRIYTESMICVGNFSVPGNRNSLWQTVAMPESAYTNFARGLYYFEVCGSRNGVTSSEFIGKFFILM